ncbi:MAG: hypothetical protein ACK440_08925 [Sphingomonadaceae bacterium]|jgi:hypothetical protein
MVQRTNELRADGSSVQCNTRTIAMARITQIASVAIGLMTQGILLGIVIGA